MKYLIAFVLGVMTVVPVSAQYDTVEIEIDTALEEADVNLNLGDIVSSIISVLITLGFLALFFYFIMGSYKWMSAGGDKAQVEEARQIFTNGLIGLALLASTFAIFRIIDRFFAIGGIETGIGDTDNVDHTPGQGDDGGTGNEKPGDDDGGGLPPGWKQPE